MAGLYLHIPFCAKRCLYCDFFSNTDSKWKAPFLSALLREMEIRKDYLGGEPLETVYFGGGTPSQLNASDFDRIFNAIARHFDLSLCTEITLEANPDDMTPAYIGSLGAFPFNRISMGIQSFDAADLHFLNRRHTREQAIRAVHTCQDRGLTNISVDLIYGLPGQTPDKWAANLEEALRLNVPHLSAYHLIYEEGTALYKLLEAGRVQPVDEESSVGFFSTLIDTLSAAGYEHYEISNFARPGFISRHNSSYWTGKKYLGLGPSAHSYNGTEREWNVSSLPIYIEGIEKGRPETEKELLDLHTQYNDFIITGLRTRWGIRPDEIRKKFGDELADYCQRQATPLLKQGLLIRQDEAIVLSRKGIFISDSLMSDLLWV